MHRASEFPRDALCAPASAGGHVQFCSLRQVHPMMSGTVLLLTGVTAALLAFAALHDLATRTVPNWVSVAILACGLVLQAVAGTLLAATGLGLLVFLAATAMWLRGWLGG